MTEIFGEGLEFIFAEYAVEPGVAPRKRHRPQHRSFMAGERDPAGGLRLVVGNVRQF